MLEFVARVVLDGMAAHQNLFVELALHAMTQCPVPVQSTSGPAHLDELLVNDSEAQGVGADLEVADFNGDGFLDLLVSRGLPHSDGSVTIYFGPWLGPWANTAQRPKVVLAAGPSYSQAVIGDIDSDGCLDVVVGFERLTSSDPTGGVHVILAELSDQGCAYGRRSPYMLEIAGDDIDLDVTDVELGDFDRDGRLDIAVAVVNPAGDHRKVVAQQLYLNQSSPGRLAFERRSTHKRLGGASAVEFLDLDQNGRLDVVFGGVGVENTSTSWGLVMMDDETESELSGSSWFDLEQVPHLADLTWIAGTRTQVAMTFNHHQCSSRGCKDSATALVADLEYGQPPRRVWSAVEGCRGFLTRIVVGPHSGARHDVAFVHVDGTKQHLTNGKLVVVEALDDAAPRAWEPIADAERVQASVSTWALALADLGDDEPSADPPVQYKGSWGPHALLMLDHRPHRAPKVYCGDGPARILFVPGAAWFSLIDGCDAGTLTIDSHRERRADILYVPGLHENSSTPEVRRLRYVATR